MRILRDQFACASTHVVGEEEFPTGSGRKPVFGSFERALIGNREVANLVDFVTPELHAQWVLFNRRKDIDQPTAHCKLPTLFNNIDARVARTGEAANHVVERDLVFRTQAHRLEIRDSVHQWLE